MADSRGPDNPEAAKRETLAERSKRIIGYSLDENLDPLEDPLENGDGNSVKRPKGKRREQVLNAQRNHRRRTQHYIQALEKEVLRLRIIETESLKRIGELELHEKKTAEALEALKVGNSGFNGILTPNSLQSQSSSAPPSIGTPEPFVEVDLDEILNSQPIPGCSISSAFDLGNDFMGAPELPIPVMKKQVPAVVTLDTQAAIDFVLELERPCRGHIRLSQMSDFDVPIQGRPVYFNSGPSHAFTASAYLMHSHRNHPTGPNTQQLPKGDIDQLLGASLRLNLEHDYTPVQVWSTLAKRCRSGQINGQMLSAMTGELSKWFRCDSFGSVISKEKAQEIFAQFCLTDE
ncbi:MAG: hypothetical protein M1828_005184 [Chrysothrix sp. TS-e1954]|nr:MAG: hypothetical protein M1828_005184 [Chrysothrix sp. TS-e1954]